MKFSGRTFLVVTTISTYCLAIMGLLVLCIMGKTSVEVFLASFAGVGTIVMYITKAYFDDKSRPEDANKGA